MKTRIELANGRIHLATILVDGENVIIKNLHRGLRLAMDEETQSDQILENVDRWHHAVRERRAGRLFFCPL